MHRKYIEGLERSYDYVLVNKGDHEDYVPAMIIKRNRLKGRSFIITQDALWKYDDPENSRNPKLMATDMQEFGVVMERCEARELIAVTRLDRWRAMSDHVCIEVAGLLNKAFGILLCTGYNLSKCLQMMDLWPKGHVPEAAFQLLWWIQDGLDQLKDMPEHRPEDDKKTVAGEVTLWQGSTKISTKDIEVKESELIIEDG
jgi:hypothetical protein